MSDEDRGISCPKCGCRDLRASYRKPFNGGYRRVRICRHCGHRVLTFEGITGNANRRPEQPNEGQSTPEEQAQLIQFRSNNRTSSAPPSFHTASG
jgi:hypothetical protein